MKKVKTIPSVDLPQDLPVEYALEERKALPNADEMAGEITRARTWRMSDVRMWDTTLSFLKGIQTDYRSRYIDDVKNRLGPENFRQVVNRLIPLYKSFVASLSTQMPKLYVSARSPAYGDELKQMAVDLLVQYWWKSNDVSSLLEQGAQWLSTCGNAALHTYVGTGDDSDDKTIKTDLVSAYDVLWEAECIRMEDAEWSAVRRVLTRSQAARLWPDKANDIELHASSIRSNGSDALETSSSGRRIEAWYIYFCDGRCGTWIDGVGWLEQGELPCDAQPVAMFRCTPLPDRIYGLSQLWPVLYQQVEYNLYRTILLDGARMMSNPLWLVPEQANVNRADLSNRAGAVVTYNALGGVPERPTPPSLPPHLFDIQSRLMGEMEDVAGMHSMTMGKRAPGISAAVSMQTLIGQDVQQMAMTRKEMERAVVKSAKTAVALWREYCPNSVKVSFFDPTIGLDVIRVVEKTKILEQPQLFIEAGSMFIADQEQRDQTIMQLAQLGIIEPKVLLDNLSMTVDRRGKLERFKALASAKRALAQVLQGFTIEMDDDPTALEALAAVFREYIESALYDQGLSEVAMTYESEDLPVETQDAMQIRENVWNVYTTAQQKLAMIAAQMMGPQGQPGSAAKPERGGGVEGAPQPPDSRKQLGPSAAKPVQGDKSNVMGQDRSGSMQTRGVRGAP